MPFKKHNPGCPCCECGPVCITVCKGSTVVLKFPDNSTQTKTADGLEDRQEICFDITGAGAYRVTVTHARLIGFIHDFTADCSHQTIAYTPTPAPDYIGMGCSGCCLPVKRVLNYADGANSVTVTYSDHDLLASTILGEPVSGWGGCAAMSFTDGEGTGCTATADCSDVGPDCNGGFGDCQTNCSDMPVPGYFFLRNDATCSGFIWAAKCPNVGAFGGPFNNCWITGPGDDCGTTQPPVGAWHQVGQFSFHGPGKSIACPPAFLAFDPDGGGGIGGIDDCFATTGGAVLTET